MPEIKHPSVIQLINSSVRSCGRSLQEPVIFQCRKGSNQSTVSELFYHTCATDLIIQGDNQHWFYYGGSDAEKKKHLLLRSRTPMHETDYYSYDSYGNTTASRRLDYRVFTGSTADSAYPYIRTETAYTSDGNFTASTKDARGNTVAQAVNANDGTLTSVTDPTGQTVNYSYDASKRVTEVTTTGDGKTYKNAYTYENDRIKTVAHNTTGDTADVTYTFDYDEMGRKTTVKVDSQTLSTNVYKDDRNSLLSEVQYGNGGKVGYTYDGYDRLTGVKYDGESTERYTYQYSANGQAGEVKDVNLGRTTRTDYDLAERPCQVEVRNDSDGSLMHRTRLKYDKLGNLERFAENVGTETHETAYTYDKDNRVTALTYDGDTQKVSYGYDELGRVTTRTAECGADTGKLTSSYSYVDGGFGTNSTTPLVKKITQNGISFEYEYDSRGNIVSEKRGNLTTTYAYDALGQLIRVNDPHENATWVYSYDRGGNILSKAKYAYTTGALGASVETIPYTYGDSNWKDKLREDFDDESSPVFCLRLHRGNRDKDHYRPLPVQRNNVKGHSPSSSADVAMHSCFRIQVSSGRFVIS